MKVRVRVKLRGGSGSGMKIRVRVTGLQGQGQGQGTLPTLWVHKRGGRWSFLVMLLLAYPGGGYSQCYHSPPRPCPGIYLAASGGSGGQWQ